MAPHTEVSSADALCRHRSQTGACRPLDPSVSFTSGAIGLAGIYYFDDIEYKEIEIEDGMAWLQRAPERIRRRRMGKFRVTFYDSDDWPIDYGSANIALARHDFQLGVGVKTRPMSSMAAADYLWYLRTAARHFWSGAIEQQMLWYSYEPSPGDVASGQKAVDDVLTWSNSQHWGGFSATLLDGGTRIRITGRISSLART